MKINVIVVWISSVNHTEIIGKIKKKKNIYIYIKYKDFWDRGSGGGVGGVVITIVTARISDV